MAVRAIAFYLLAAVTVGAGFAVVSAKNPVHSVLFLIGAFFSAAGLFVLLGAEFLAMLLVVVYVGAVAVLFLFVVMMLDIDFGSLREGFVRYLPVGGGGGARRTAGRDGAGRRRRRHHRRGQGRGGAGHPARRPQHRADRPGAL